MFLGGYRLSRLVVLSLMFFLAVTAPCSSHSYDPDPYDDVPPVVSIDINYVVPSAIHIRQSNVPNGSWQSAALLSSPIPEARLALAENPFAAVLAHGSPQLAIPLRR